MLRFNLILMNYFHTHTQKLLKLKSFVLWCRFLVAHLLVFPLCPPLSTDAFHFRMCESIYVRVCVCVCLWHCNYTKAKRIYIFGCISNLQHAAMLSPPPRINHSTDSISCCL